MRGRRAVFVAFVIWPFAVATVLDNGLVRLNPSADLTKLLVAPESNIASWMVRTSWMALSMMQFLAWRSSFIAFHFASRRIHLDEGRVLLSESTINRECGLHKAFLIGSGGVGGEMGPAAATR